MTAPEWGDPEETQLVLFRPIADPGDGTFFRSNSLSGGERNRLYLNQASNFKDVSLVSGIDFREDGRGFALLDFNQDGWLDIALASPNTPRLRLLENRVRQLQASVNGGAAEDAKPVANYVSLKLIGGNDSPEPSTELSPRDAYGAQVLVWIGDSKRAFQYACGEGLSSQNQSRLHIGLGAANQIDLVEIRWPSGKVTELKSVAAGSLVTAHELTAVSDEVTE